jgi:tetratricopeptide (TPR) repeat protein
LRRFYFWLGIAIFFAAQASGAIYSYRDEYGRLYLTDSPPNKNYKIVVTSRKDREGPASPGSSTHKNLFSGLKSQAVLLPNAETYSKYINEAAQKHGVDPYLIKSVIKAESDFDAKALSSKGAMGLMQLIPSTAKLMGCKNAYSPRQNIMGGTKYLKRLLKRFKGKVDYALAGYNAGPGNVDKYRGIPPFRETKNYVKKVKHYYKKYSSGVRSFKNRRTVRTIPSVRSDLTNRLTKAYNHFKNNEIDTAMEAYREVLNIYPRNTQALYNLACLLDMDRCYEEAIDVYKETLKQDPYLDKARYNLAVIYERMGMHVQAISSWEKYVETTKDKEKIRMAEKFIHELKEYASIN